MLASLPGFILEFSLGPLRVESVCMSAVLSSPSLVFVGLPQLTFSTFWGGIVSLHIPGAFSCAAMNIVSLTSLFVMLVYSRSLSCRSRLIGGSFAMGDGSGNRCSLRVAHFSECATAGGWSSPQSIGGDVYILEV